MPSSPPDAALEGWPVVSVDEAHARLTAPGAPFEVREEEVRGQRLEVFRRRGGHLRELLERSRSFGDAEFYVFDDGRRATFAEHLRDVASVAAALREKYGVGPGDPVAILAANSPEWITTFWAAVSLGAVAVGMNGWWQGDEIRHGLELARPVLLVADEKRLARLGGADPGVPLVVVERDFDALRRHAPGAALPDVPIAEDDPAVVLFTSGTTGRPKGAITTHRNFFSYLGLVAFAGARRALMGGRPWPPPREPGQGQDSVLVVTPMFHVSGLHGAAFMAVVSGMKIVVTTGRFDPEKVLRLTHEERISRWGGVATQVWRLLEHPRFEAYDVSCVRSIGGGGSPWSPELQRLIRARIPRAAMSLNVGYGLTESAGLATMADDAMLLHRPESVGCRLATVGLEIRGPDGERLPDGAEGEICLRGANVTPGYWNDPEGTAAAFFPDGWLRTGDVGRLDDGYLTLASRKRDLILRGGENVYPIEIENRLEEHAGIAEAAVVGVDHRELGQEVKAVVVPRPGARLEAEEVRAFLAERLAYYKVPAYVEIRTEPLPRNATGKVLKNVLQGEAENPFVEE